MSALRLDRFTHKERALENLGGLSPIAGMETLGTSQTAGRCEEPNGDSSVLQPVAYSLYQLCSL